MKRQTLIPRSRRAALTGGRFWALVVFALCAQIWAGADVVRAAPPVPGTSSVKVPTDADADNPYRFSASDFSFTDAERDALQSITFTAPLPDSSKGTFRVGSSAARVGQTVAAADIGTITYYPAAGAQALNGYALIKFTVRAGGQSSTENTRTLHQGGSVRIDTVVPVVVVPMNSAPTGAINITAADRTAMDTWNEDQRLSAASAVMDDDGINTSTIAWEWQQSNNPIEGATSHIFTPLQAHVGRRIRVCFSYTDMFATPKMERVCSPAVTVINASDAPVGGDSTVNVPANASSSAPHPFDLGDFPITADEDVPPDTINGIRIATLPTAGALAVVGETVTIARNTNLSLAQLRNLAYYPADGATQMDNYDSFTYWVIDTGVAATGLDGTPIGINVAASAATLTINLTNARNAAGAPAVAYASGITAPTEESPITASQGSVTDPDSNPPANIGAISWQWSQADSNGGAYADIMGATAAAFAPDDPQVDKFLRVCASFADGGGNSERRCLQLDTAVANVNDPATIRLTVPGFIPLTGAPEEGRSLLLADSRLEDPDGSSRSGLTASYAWSHDNKGDGNFANIIDNHDAAWSPAQEHVGSRIRGCLSFTDDRGSRENACADTLPVINVNDAPVGLTPRISVSVGASESAPYRFRPQDFAFADDDGDGLESVTLIGVLPGSGMSAGTMALDGTALTAAPAEAITRAQLQAGALTYWPASGQQPTDINELEATYVRFSFHVTDDGDGPGGDVNADKTSAANGSIRIRLVQTQQAAATGGPQIIVANVAAAAAYPEGSELLARVHGIVERNGIDESTLIWQWQQSASADRGFVNIAGATAEGGDEAAFTLTQAQARAGRHIRACVSFMDQHPTSPAREGPLCGPSVRINAAPRALPSTVLVSTSATAAAPYAFKASDFRFADADGGSGATGSALASVTIINAPNKGTLLIDGDALVTSGSGQNNVVDVSDIPTLTYYQDADGTEPAQNYAQFRFTVSDGIESSAAATMRIDLGDSLRLRLRVFLEGPLR